MSDTTIHNRPGASIVRAFRRINAAAEVIAAARALVLHIRSMRQSARDPIMRSADWYDMQADTSKTNLDRLDAAITAYDATEGT